VFAWKKVKHWRNIIDIFSFLRVLQVKERFLAEAAKEEKATTPPFTTLCAFFPSRANGFTFLDSLYNISFSTPQWSRKKTVINILLGTSRLCFYNFLKIPNYTVQICLLSINKLYSNIDIAFKFDSWRFYIVNKKISKMKFY